MARVRLWGSLAAALDGRTEVELDAATLRELLDALVREHPAARPFIERGVSVAIDGRIYTDSWFAPVRPDSEVVLMSQIRGG